MGWLEFCKDCDFGLNYHLGKDNMVADALSQNSLHMSALMVIELHLIEKSRDLSLVCEVMPRSVCLGMLKLINSLLEDIRERHKSDLGLIDNLVLINQGKEVDFKVDENGIIKF